MSAATPVAALGVNAVHVAPTVPRAAFVHVCGRQGEVEVVAGVRWGSWRGGRQGEVGCDGSEVGWRGRARGRARGRTR